MTWNKDFFRRKALWSAAMLLLCSFCACGATGEEPVVVLERETEEETPIVATVEYGEVVSVGKLNCTYQPTRQEDLYWGTQNRFVVRVDVKKGDIVEEGELLAALDVGDLEEEQRQFEHEMKALQLKLKQTRELKEYDLNAADILYSYTNKTAKDKQELEKKRQGIEQQYRYSIEDLEDSLLLAEKKLEKSAEELQGGLMKAGISGEVTYVKDGLLDSYSDTQEKVMTISDLDSCFFVCEDRTYAADIKADQVYQLMLNSQTDGITFVEVVPDFQEGMEDRLLFKTVNGEILETGVTGNIQLELDKKEQVLCVPNEAVHTSGDESFVYIWDKDKISMRYVTVGLVGQEMTEIREGLRQGEQIIIK